MARRTNSQASPQAGPRRRNPAPAADLRQGLPVSKTNLTQQERALLPDPDWVTEDDADAIISMRRLRRPGRTYTLDEVMHRLGYDVAR
ncbi:MAG: hypothetical protein Q8N47_07195 [Bryobacterales bacterium]|nr:hypothetical protein [Bryobacterales bacterium]